MLLVDLILPSSTSAPCQALFLAVCFLSLLPTRTFTGSLISLLLCFSALPSYPVMQDKESITIWLFVFVFFFPDNSFAFFALNCSIYQFLGQFKSFWVVSLSLIFSPCEPPPMLCHWQVPSFYMTSSRSLILRVNSAVLTLILLCSSSHYEQTILGYSIDFMDFNFFPIMFLLSTL